MYYSLLGDETSIYIAYWPDNVVAIEGSNVSVDCYTVSPTTTVISGSIVFSSITSLNKSLDDQYEPLSRYVSKSTMLLNNVQLSDAGGYLCRVLDLVHDVNKTTNLTVISGTSVGGTLIMFDCYSVTDPLHVDSFINLNTTYISCTVTVDPLLNNRLSDVSVLIWLYSDTSRHKMLYSQRIEADNVITIATNVGDTGTYGCHASIDNFITSRNVSVKILSSVVEESHDLELLPLLVAVAVVIFLFIVMFIVIMFCLVYRYSNSSSSRQYSNMVSRTKIGARLSTNSCASADFVINKSSVSCYVNMLVISHLLFNHIVWQ